MTEFNTWKIWKEEFDEICRLELEGGINKKGARRLLIFTEGFMFKVSSTNTNELDLESLNILKEIRKKNKLMMGRKR